MSKRALAILLMAMLAIPLVVLAEIVTATSDPFTFPAIDNIRQKKISSSVTLFSSKGFSSITNAITLSWSIPASIEAQKGQITLFSLQGKAIKTFDLKTSTGTVTWKVPRSQAKYSVLIARLSCGSHVSTLKLILCR